MSELHAIGAIVVLVAVAALAVGSGVSAWLDRWPRPAEALRRVVLALIAAQVALGAASWLSGDRPREPLHLLYGIGLLAVVPLAQSFAEDAPPSLQRGVVAVGAVVGLLLGWRLFVTG